jgi:hypothetical protein
MVANVCGKLGMSAAAEPVNAVARAGAQPLGTSSLPCPQQLELMRGVDGTLPVGAIHMVRGRGRPKGARNKRSKKIADYYVARYGDPLDAIGQMANTPLRQLIEVLMEADGSAEREAHLLEGVDEAITHIKLLAAIPGDAKDKREMAEKLADAIDKLAFAASRISGKPGKLALDALALQMQAHFRATEYVHGKQPIAIDFNKSADLVIFAPELLRANGIDPVELQKAITERGLEAFDPEALRIVDGTEPGEFSEVGPDDEEDGGVND